MGFKGAIIPAIFFCVAVFGIAQSAITINAYLTTNKPKDSSFNFSIAVMVFSVFLLFGGGYFIYKAFTGGDEAAEESVEAAAEAAAEAKLGGLNLPSTNEIIATVPNIQGSANVPGLRAAEQNFEAAVQKTKSELDTLVASVKNRVSNKVGAIQKIAVAGA
jgi:hypothetical protein